MCTSFYLQKYLLAIAVAAVIITLGVLNADWNSDRVQPERKHERGPVGNSIPTNGTTKFRSDNIKSLPLSKEGTILQKYALEVSYDQTVACV